MESDATAIIFSVIGVGVVLAGLILTVTGRLSTRLTAVEKDTAQLAGLLKGLGLIGRTTSRVSGDADCTEVLNRGPMLGSTLLRSPPARREGLGEGLSA